MTEWFSNGGIMMWPMLAVAIGIVILAARAAARLYGRAKTESAATRETGRERGSLTAEPPAEVDRWLQAILFWGGMAVLLGLLGTVVGVIVMTQAISLAGSVEPPLVWSGFGVSLITFVFGLLIFLFAAFAWFALRHWSGRVAA